jgi:predicted DNA-binding ribbon-helix-helix protein
VSGESQALPHVIEANESGLTPEFRVITVGDKRRGVRLERVFWQTLTAIAGRRKLKLSALVTEALSAEDSLGENVASVLRCYALEASEADRLALLPQSEPNFMVSLLQQAPIPAFAINRQKRLQQVNSEFMQLLRMIAGSTAPKIAAEFVHLTLETPVEQIFKRLAEGEHLVQTTYLIQLDAKQRRGRLKIVPVPSASEQLLVGYVIT